MSRPVGSVNKTTLNITSAIRDAFTHEDCLYIAKRLMTLTRDEDKDIALKAMSLFLSRFTISQEKLGEIVQEQLKVESKEHFEELMRKLIDECKPNASNADGLQKI